MTCFKRFVIMHCAPAKPSYANAIPHRLHGGPYVLSFLCSLAKLTGSVVLFVLSWFSPNDVRSRLYLRSVQPSLAARRLPFFSIHRDL